MKPDHGVRSTLLVVVAVGIALSTMFPRQLEGQRSTSGSKPNPHDLTKLEQSFSNYSKDFREMLKATQGEGFEIVNDLDHTATTAEDRLGAAGAMLKMYDNISCNSDRAMVKPILKRELAMYSWLFDQETGRTAGALTFVKVPAAAQMGLQMKDELRDAKEKLTAIAASLD